jgi:hypothetical protein
MVKKASLELEKFNSCGNENGLVGFPGLGISELFLADHDDASRVLDVCCPKTSTCPGLFTQWIANSA